MVRIRLNTGVTTIRHKAAGDVGQLHLSAAIPIMHLVLRKTLRGSAAGRAEGTDAPLG